MKNFQKFQQKFPTSSENISALKVKIAIVVMLQIKN